MFAIEYYTAIGPIELGALAYCDDAKKSVMDPLFRHTFIFCEKDGRFYWINNAWKLNNGILGPYASVQGIYKDIRRMYKSCRKRDTAFLDLELIAFEMTLDAQTTVSEYTQDIICNSDSEVFAYDRWIRELSQHSE